jgi:hypothetical protein
VPAGHRMGSGIRRPSPDRMREERNVAVLINLMPSHPHAEKSPFLLGCLFIVRHPYSGFIN